MKKRRGPGRPKLEKGQARSETLRVRLTKREKGRVLDAAKNEAQTPSDWARKRLLARH